MRLRPEAPSIYLPNSGQIDLNAIGVEAGQNNNSQTGLNDAAVRGLIGKASGAQNAMNEYYGASSALIDLTASAPVYYEYNPTGTTALGSGTWNFGLETSTTKSGTGGSAGNQRLMVDGITYICEYDITLSLGRDGGACYLGAIKRTSSVVTGLNFIGQKRLELFSSPNMSVLATSGGRKTGSLTFNDSGVAPAQVGVICEAYKPASSTRTNFARVEVHSLKITEA